MVAFIKNNKKILFCLTLLGLFVVAFNVLALELNWPPSPAPGDDRILLTNNSTLTELVGYFYQWLIAIGGLTAFISLISAGFQYLTSAGNPTKMGEARTQITSAVLGLALLLSSWLILGTINPELTTLDISVPPLPSSSIDPLEEPPPPSAEECEFVTLYSEVNYSGSSYNLTPNSTYTTWTPRSVKMEHGNCTLEFYKTAGCTGDYEGFLNSSYANIESMFGSTTFAELACVKCIATVSPY
jgi:hypothetical protein